MSKKIYVPETERLTMNTAEAASMLGVSVETIRKLSKRPDFPSFKNGRHILIPRAAFTDWVNGYRG